MLEAGIAVGDTLLMDGVGVTGVTVKLAQSEEAPPELFTFTYQVPMSLSLLI